MKFFCFSLLNIKYNLFFIIKESKKGLELELKNLYCAIGNRKYSVKVYYVYDFYYSLRYY